MTPVISVLAGIAPKLFDIVDKAVGDKDLAIRLKSDLASQMLNANSEMAKAGASVVIAEAQGESWLQRNWRPMLMVWFAFLIGAYWFGYVPSNLPEKIVEDLFTLVQIGVGGYVVGRSGEKIASTVAPYLSKG